MTIDFEHSLKNAFQSGINLFVGAGFSILAKDPEGRFMPLGKDLAKELAAVFGKSDLFSLPQLSSILEASNKAGFYQYLEKRFDVAQIDPLYQNLFNINIKSIYTTNIDNLIVKLFEKDPERFINNQIINGPSEDPNAINFVPLHGSIKVEPRQYVFDVSGLANIYNDAQRVWNSLSREIETRPTLFIGYSFNDSSVIQALTSRQTFQNAKKEFWIVLRDEDIEYREFFESMGFHIINADLVSFLRYLSTSSYERINPQIEKERYEILSPYCVPHSIFEARVQRPINDFFSGSTPKWCDVLSGQIFKTHYLAEIVDRIYSKKHLILIGAPVSGKTTLLMQAATCLTSCSTRLFFDSISKERAEFVVKLLAGDNAIVFIDNLYDSIEAITYFEQFDNLTLVCAERSHYFAIVSHLFNQDKYKILNVTSLTDADLQGVFNAIPSGIRSSYLKKEQTGEHYDNDSIFEFIIRNVNLQNIKDRYVNALKELEVKDVDLAEFMVLCAYMHSCRIPLSFEMAYDYFDDYDYQSFFNLRDDASDIIRDYIPLESESYEEMDYYYPRSLYVAEVIMKSCSPELLKRVLRGVIAKIPTLHICHYNSFRRYAYDKTIVLRAFPGWEEGKRYYEQAFLYDTRNPYVLQQGALYLAQKQQFDLAFSWIDRAISMTENKYFSIRNSHAIILFNANIDRTGDEVRSELDRSMSILEKCMRDDARKRFHADTFGRQAIRYFNRYGDEKALSYLQQALTWLSMEVNNSQWDDELRATRDKISSILSR